MKIDLSHSSPQMDAESETMDRLGELILYIADRCRTEPTFGSVNLNKILYYSDFLHFAGTGRTITGVKYEKEKWGPVPEKRIFLFVRDKLVKQGRLEIAPVERFDFIQKRPRAIDTPDMSKFSPGELALVNMVSDKICRYSAKEISDVTHEDIGWQWAEFGQNIPAFSVWVRRIEQIPAEHIKSLKEGAQQALAAHRKAAA